ncbi:unknown protein [Cronobacter turicensis z3032]|uniref:Uncharacterized protein n=1 Tax=Cronobacter turicensis (strain DSM 18703 / CCUG 55852 / LMG 23827 / z3032) TaxID=693216 RepID=C9XYD1_CROTZ|nr:unknown protein [Cronobacter turicensis z3032]
MRRRKIDFGWSDDETLDCFHRDEGATAIDVSTLVITFFGVLAEITACASMRGVLAFWTMKHGNLVTLVM